MRKLIRVVLIVLVFSVAVSTARFAAVSGEETVPGRSSRNSDTSPMPPTVELTASSGDYSAYLSWKATENGSVIKGYDIKYYSADISETELGSISLPAEKTSAVISGLSGGIEYIIKLTAKSDAGNTTVTAVVTPNDPDLATVTAVKNEIETSSVAIHMNLANTKEAVSSYLLSYFGRYSEYGVKIKDVIIKDFTAASPLSVEEPDAPAGSFTFILELNKGDVSLTTRIIEAEIDNKTSIVYITAEKFSVMTGEELTVKATALDIDDKTYSWYVAASDSDDGTLIQDSDSDTYKVNTDKAGEYYLYCVCGGVSSSRIKVTVTEPFTAVSDIELSTDVITTSEATILRATVYPANAANKNVIWSIENDGGCLAELSGRTVTAYKPGTVTVKATVRNGLSDGDYEKIFYITVRERSGQQSDNDDDVSGGTNIKETELDCSKIKGIESITVLSEKGMIQVTAVTHETVNRILTESNITADEENIIGAVKFVYEKGAIAHDVQLKIKGYDNRTVNVLTVNSNGSRNPTVQQPENGVIKGNAVSPDTVILYTVSVDAIKNEVFPAALILVIPAAAAAAFIAYIVIKDNGKRRKKERK